MGTKAIGLSDALFSRTQQRVMGLLFGSPERSFYVNEVTRLAGVGTGTVQRELEGMASCGLLTVTKQGNQKHYQANRESPIFAELRGIVLKTFGVADVLRDALKPWGDRVEAAFVYGSVAKGTDKAGSDIDLMIVSDRLAYPEIIEALVTAEKRIGRRVNPTLYKPAEFRRKLADENAFLRRVMERPKLNLIGSTDGLAEPRKARKGR
jgi:predicted nucleotidyltransferase